MPNFFVENNFYQGTSEACIIDLTPPVFSGINFLDVESRGQIRAGWSAATDPTPPIRYEIYIQASNSVGLFNTSNIIAITPNLFYDIFTLPDGSFLQNGVTYFVGVRAIDGVNNRDSNTVSLSVISTGVLTSIDVYETKAAWSINDSSQFEITAWANKNSSLAVSPDAILGAASYQVYSPSGTAIVGMSGTVPTPNAQGLYVFSPVANQLVQDSEHYEIRVIVSVDGEDRVNFIEVNYVNPQNNLSGVIDINNSNQITGSFWVTENNAIISDSRLGTASYEVYNSSGALVSGLSQTGITPDVNGFYVITPTSFGSNDITKAYIVKIEATIAGESKSNYITLGNQPAVYDCKAVFSINASNQLEATFWATKNTVLVGPALLTTASYQVYDKNGVIVSGLSQTGITPDANGQFHTTPVSASLLTDLTHYTAIINISVAGLVRTSVKGFTLLGN